ncbi:MAG: hypothetical protein ACKVHO_17925 [Verrucomicrobiia bacterium]|jgi:hypothetical protein
MATPVPQKLLLKPGMLARFINTPAGFWDTFGTLPQKVALHSGGSETSDWVLLFSKDERELNKLAANAVSSVKTNGTLWVAFPKKPSGKQTTLTPRAGWTVLEDAGLQSMASAAIDDVWSALRWKKS